MGEAKNKKHKIIIYGLAVHVLLLLAVFDIYFSSPIDHGMTPIKFTISPPADRLVLFVADGLRAEAIFGDDNKYRTPFLTSILENNGSWAVAHTRVPTESRPGHVALLGGIYEDPSAILKGWKANPVTFDSVINQSTNAWCWGSPDIVSVFNKDNSPHIRLYSYSADIEDFGKNNTGLLDTWVFDKVRKFLKGEVGHCSNDCDKYYARGNFFFLHLLGIDTAGHGFKPHSKEYVENIELVDRNVKEMYESFEKVFGNGTTAYVFTADHGMTDWGSHGAGSSHETDVPLIVWGSGVKRNKKEQAVNQIDIAPLLSSLIGVSIPINSLGIIPDNFLNLNEQYRSSVLFTNALQLLQIFNVKKARIENHAFIVRQYKGLSSYDVNDEIDRLKRFTKGENYDQLINETKLFMTDILRGIDYYHNYYQYPLLVSVSLGFAMWVLFLIISLSDGKQRTRANLGFLSSKEVLTVLVLVVALLCYKHNFPVTYYLYFSFPLVMVHFILNEFSSLLHTLKILGNSNATDTFVNIAIYVFGMELLVYGFFNRLSFTALMIIVAFLVNTSKSLVRSLNARDKILWFFVCMSLAIFPTLPVMKTSFNTPFYLAGCLIWTATFMLMYLKGTGFYARTYRNDTHYQVFHVQFLLFVIAVVYNLAVQYDVIPNDSPLKYFAWLISVVPVALVPLTSKFIVMRLIATFFAFAPFYVLVSPNYELAFSAVYALTLCTWLVFECKSLERSSNVIYYVRFENYRSRDDINSDMFRRAFLFMVFIFVGFFGTGNIASLNSFDPMWVRAFLTVFSPFKMMGIIFVKIAVPFVFTCCVFRAINAVGKENVLRMFCIVLIFSDLMVLQFLYMITNVGSWLDIGSSLSHFIIMEGFVTILILLYGFAHFLTTVTY